MAIPGVLCRGAEPADRPTVLVVVGAAGTPEYGEQFAAWAQRWDAAADRGGAEFVRIPSPGETGSADGEADDRERLQEWLAGAERTGARPLWLVLIGHGTFDGREAKFNLRGPDVSAAELAGWLEPFQRPLAVINCSSSSSPFLNRLSAPQRIVITATRSGAERNFARFGDYLSRAVGDPQADLDKDQQTSLLEAFLAAAHGVEAFYEQEARLATEHALLDDNGDKLGTPADWYQGVRAIRRAKDGAAADGPRAHQWHLVPSAREEALTADVRRQRDQLELAIEALRDQKATLAEDEYYRRLEELLVPLARLYAE